MATRTELLRQHRELSIAIRASEDWQASYKDDPKTFKALLAGEADLEASAGAYLRDLAQRSLGYVDWSRLPQPVTADAGPVLNNSDPVWKQEETLLASAILDIVTELVATGAIAGENLYGIPIGFTTLDEAILIAARTQVAQLVSNVTATSRDLIRESIRQSIARGEDVNLAKARLLDVINNPVRAELIAHTESVNAYQRGLKNFGKVTGAVSKTWDGLAGACKLCSPLVGKTIPIDDLFEGGYDHPSRHPRCRCGLIYNYS
ncbi:phage minor head protein [Streptomyces turgidiscabies]|uniref:phage minor head protein n=1 Tax=Streptomyces turgidiscabies TaxID=85558 RepID=UPI0038F60122